MGKKKQALEQGAPEYEEYEEIARNIFFSEIIIDNIMMIYYWYQCV